MQWKEFLNWLNVRGFNASNETTIPYGRRIDVKDASSSVAVNYYDSGKVSVQGKDSSLKNEIEAFLGCKTKTKATKQELDTSEFIGSDESGKGDYFGPLVVAAAYVSPKQEAEVLALGVKDSKKLSDAKIISMAKELQKLCTYEVCSLLPAEYNFIYQQEQNLNRILHRLHRDCHHAVLQKLTVKPKGCIIDQYSARTHDLEQVMANLNLPIVQQTKAEEYLPVACASILARANFIKSMQEMGERWSFDFPKGASSAVDLAASQFLELYGKEKIIEVAKIHFATSKKIGLLTD